MNGSEAASVGNIIRFWRHSRRLSQMELALRAGLSSRHLSFVETGRSRASPMTLLNLAQVLDLPLQDQNHLLLASGYAPRFPATELTDSKMYDLRRLIDLILQSHAPYPALVIDQGWDILMSNQGHQRLLEKMIPGNALSQVGTDNLMRLFFHPRGLKRSILNWDHIAPIFINGLRRELAMQPTNQKLAELTEEIANWVSASDHKVVEAPPRSDEFAIEIVMETEGRRFSLISTTLCFSAPLSVALQNIKIETFYPANRESEKTLMDLVGHG